MDPRTQQTAAVAVLTKLADMNPFGDDADPDQSLLFTRFDGWKDEGGVIFNSAI